MAFPIRIMIHIHVISISMLVYSITGRLKLRRCNKKYEQCFAMFCLRICTERNENQTRLEQQKRRVAPLADGHPETWSVVEFGSRRSVVFAEFSI